MEKLISNSLSSEELDELLAAMKEQEVQEKISVFLEQYFRHLLEQLNAEDEGAQ
ncbi:hypothetical protein [Leadbetterella sp. DM7]|uniref:hypothetical protein n=1 Tax=Leadbetterella sp. DM7 TaxID=3235085 RepID=UPI00349EB914